MVRHLGFIVRFYPELPKEKFGIFCFVRVFIRRGRFWTYRKLYIKVMFRFYVHAMRPLTWRSVGALGSATSRLLFESE